MAETVTTVAMDITANTDDATKGLSKLKNSLNGVIAPLKKTTSGMKSLTDRLNGLKQNLLASKNALKDFIKNSSKLSDFTTKFLKSIKRIALYRTVRFLLSTFVNMVKEGMDNIYKYSTLIGGRLAKDMDSLATGFLYAKNSIATFTSQLLSALTPALLKIADVIAQIFTYLAKLVAVAMGKHTFTEATKSVKKYGDEAKKTQLVLAGFDELNVLSDGGSSNTADVGSMFKETEIPIDEYKNLQETLEKIRKIVDLIGVAFLSWKVVTILEKIGLMKKTAEGLLGVFTKLGKVIGLALLVDGIANCIKAFKDFRESGKLTKDGLKDLEIGIGEIGVALTLLSGSWIPLAIAGFGILVADIVKDWDTAGKKTDEVIENMKKKWNTGIQNMKDYFTERKGKFTEEVKGMWKEIKTNASNTAKEVKEAWKTAVNNIKNFFATIPTKFKEVMKDVITRVEKTVNNIVNAFNSSGFLRGVNKILGTSISLPTISIAKYSTGGVLEDGLFTMNRGEIAGKFNNGTSVVANNEQIIEGIKRGVMEAMAQSKQNVTFVVEGDPQGMFKVMRKEANNYRTQTGKFAF